MASAAGSPANSAAVTMVDHSAPASSAPPLIQPTSAAPAPAGPAAMSCAAVQAQAMAQTLPSDIIWAIDTSGSMVSSFEAIQSALNRFSERVVMAGIDAHIVLLAGSLLCVPPPLGSGMQCAVDPAGALGIPIGNLGGAPAMVVDSHAPSFLHLDTPFGSALGMSTLLDNFPYYKHMLRPNARTQLVLTEDGAPRMTAAAVTEHVEGRASASLTEAWQPPLQPGTYTWNGVVCQTGSRTCGGPSGAPATTLQLIQDTQGVLADLELASTGGDPFGQLLDELASAVIVGAKLSCDYEIPAAPAGATFDRNLVNVVYTAAGTDTTFPRVSALEHCAGRTAWAYDDDAAPRLVRLCPAACNLVQQDSAAMVNIGFGCATELAPE